MKIIKIEPNPGGSRPPLQEWNSPVPPDGYAVCPEEFCSVFYSTTPAGFVTIETEEQEHGLTIVSMEVNEEALAAWNAAEASKSTAEPTAEEQIAELKAELDATDYKIIKCSECQLAGLELPYDVAALHAERQAIRDQINALEAEVGAEENE